MIRLAAPATAVIAAVDSLPHRRVTFDPAEVDGPPWRTDRHRTVVGREPPGPPVPGGPWESARDVLRDYDFVPPELVRAAYRPGPPQGRDIVLIGRTGPVLVLMGVRITAVFDESGDTHRTWGWAYRTLAGHLQRGEVGYRVSKDLRTGEVAFCATVTWRPAPELGPALRLAWRLFGSRRQRRFYPRIVERMRERVRERPDPGPPGPFVQVPLGMPAAAGRAAVVLAHPAGVG